MRKRERKLSVRFRSLALSHLPRSSSLFLEKKTSIPSLLHGEPSAVLPVLRFVFNRYPHALELCAIAAAVGGGGGACCCASSERDATAAAGKETASVALSAGRALLSAACPPARFATAAVRALRHGLGIQRVGLTPAQLLERVSRKPEVEFGGRFFFEARGGGERDGRAKRSTGCAKRSTFFSPVSFSPDIFFESSKIPKQKIGIL